MEDPRVVVGVTGSLANLAALHVAVGYARDRRWPLLAVSVYPPPANEFGRGHRTAPPAVPEPAARVLEQAFTDGFGAVPTDIELTMRVAHGNPAGVLVCSAWRPDDLLVIGASQRGLRRLTHPTVSAECRRRARQLIVVPRPPLLAELGQLQHIRDIRGLASI